MTYSNFDSRLRRSSPLPPSLLAPVTRSPRKRKSKRRASAVKAAITALLLLSCGAMAEDAGATLPGSTSASPARQVSIVTMMTLAAGAAAVVCTLVGCRRVVGV